MEGKKDEMIMVLATISWTNPPQKEIGGRPGGGLRSLRFGLIAKLIRPKDLSNISIRGISKCPIPTPMKGVRNKSIKNNWILPRKNDRSIWIYTKTTIPFQNRAKTNSEAISPIPVFPVWFWGEMLLDLFTFLCSNIEFPFLIYERNSVTYKHYWNQGLNEGIGIRRKYRLILLQKCIILSSLFILKSFN